MKFPKLKTGGATLLKSLLPSLFLVLKYSILFAQAPAITSFSPVSGPVGSTVTINGSNFNTGASNNIVFFGAVRAVVNVASASQLTVTVPVGATNSPITVTANRLTAYSQNLFIPTFANGGPFAPSAFDTKVDIPVNSTVYSTLPNVKDLDGDGKPDIFVITNSNTSISIFRNINSMPGTINLNSLAPKVDIGGSGTMATIFAEDMDGDGKPDLITFDSQARVISVFKNNSTPGNLSFALSVTVVGGKSAISTIAVADINGDGNPDIVASNITDNTFSVFINTGTSSGISFAPKIDIVSGVNPYTIAAADFDGDGKTDLAVASYNINGQSIISVFKNTSSGNNVSFTRADYSVNNARVMRAGDMDGDGKPDLVMQDSYHPCVFRNTSTIGAITFDRTDFPQYNNASDVSALADMDGDGKLDIVENVGDLARIYKNNSTPGALAFDAPAKYVASNAAIMADIDGDGKPDMIGMTNTLCIVRNRITEPFITAITPETALAGMPVILTGVNFTGATSVTFGGVNAASFTVNSPSSITAVVGTGATGTVNVQTQYGTATGPNFVYGTPAPVVNSFTPLLGPVGTTVTISGKNFNTNAANNMVFFGVARAAVVSATATQLVVKVPQGANYQPLTVSTNGYTASSSRAFDVTFTGTGPFAPNSFKHSLTLTTNNFRTNALIADLDGDGKTDVICHNSTILSVYRNTSTPGNTSFAPVISITPGTGTNVVYIFDLDADGKPDMVCANAADKKLLIYKNNSSPGSINFASPMVISNSAGPCAVVVADLDNDGKPDLAVSNNLTHSFSIYRNTTTGGSLSFDAAVNITVDDSTSGILAADLNNDGKIDLITTTNVSQFNYTRTYRNSSSLGHFSFTFDSYYPTTSYPDIFIGDFDGDGSPDLEIPIGYSSVYLYKYTQGENWGDPIIRPALLMVNSGQYPSGAALGDMDGDGIPDMAICDGFSPGMISVCKNLSVPGKFAFGPKNDYARSATNTGGASLSGFNAVAIADIDGDGRPDMVTNENASGNIAILINTINAPAIASFTPTSAVAGATVTITGTNFTDATAVSFGGVAAASFTVDSPTSITVVVGQGASGDVSVTTPIAPGILPGFTFLPAPTIASFTPLAAGPGKTVTLTGTNFTGATAVTFGGVNAQSFTVVSPTVITAVIGAIGASGSIAVTVPGGTTTLAGFTFSPAPVITSFSPANGPVGSSVVINGNNLGTGAGSNIVYFGAAKATVTAASAQQLTVTVPAGTTFQPLTLTNLSTGLTCYAASGFLPTFKTKYSVAATDFDPKVDFTAGAGAKASAIGDIDGDGKPDLVVVNSTANTVSIFRNTAGSGNITAGSFAAKIDLPAGGGAQGVSIADLDGDGKSDLTVANLTDNTLSVYLNTSTTGNISFAAKITLTTGKGPYGVTCADVDGDGRIDLICSNSTDNTVSVLKNVGTAGSLLFSPKVDYTVGVTPHGIVAGDVTGDGKTDIVTGNSGNGISVLVNTSIGGLINSASFATHADAIVGAVMESVALGDVDQNGTQDIITVNSRAGTVTVFTDLIGPNYVSFSSTTTFPVDANPTSVALADVDGDGRPDIITGSASTNTLSILRNIMPYGGAHVPAFAAKVSLTMSNTPSFISIGDIDGDGRPDLLTVNTANNSISVLRNNPTAAPAAIPAPVVTSYSPVSAAAGTNVTINGSNFNTAAANNIVSMGAVQAKVNSATASQLNITVPVSTTYQPISVLNTGSNLMGASTLPFNATFASKNKLSAADISAAVTFNTTVAPFGIAAGDIDGDGKPDLVVSNPTNNTISVYRNTSASGSITTSSFAAKVDFSAGATPQNIIISDIDGDGKPDLVVESGYYTGPVSILRNTSVSGTITSSSFAAAVNLTVDNPASGYVPSYASNVKVADMDGDGKPDIISGNLTIMINNSTPGNLTAASFQKNLYVIDQVLSSFAIYDINNDGKPDVIFSGNNNVEIALNNSVAGNLSLNAPILLTNSRGGSSITMVDVDGDGKADIVTAAPSYGSISLMHNVMTGNTVTATSFEDHVEYNTTPAVYNAANGANYLAVADMDGDGRPDLLAIGLGLNTVSVFRNISTPYTAGYSFLDNKFDVNAGAVVSGLAVADIDGDGKPDILTTNQGAKTFSVLRNSPTPPVTPGAAPVITSVSPASGAVGSQVVITGKNFNTSPASNTVYFGVTKAAVNSATATSISVTVPVSATYEFPSVLNSANSLTGYAPNKFITTFPSKNDITAQDFEARVPIMNFSAYDVHAVDIDGDGKPDLIFHDGYQSVGILRNTSTPGPIKPINFGVVNNDPSYFSFAVGLDPQFIKVTDIDGDGKPDLLVTYYSFYGIGISVLLNQSTPGTIKFAPKVDVDYNSVPFGNNFYVINTGDVDGDGKPEILIATAYYKGVSVLPNTSTPGKVSFTSRYDFETGRQASTVNLADIDGDGKPELIAANMGDNTISIMRNITPTGEINAASFAKHVDFAASKTPQYVAIGDVNADGKPDIVVSGTGGPGVILQNTSTTGTVDATSMSAPVELGVGAFQRVEIADMDGDGKPDIVLNYAILRNQAGTGVINKSFFAAKPVTVDPSASFDYFNVDDVDGDGKPDIVGASHYSGVGVVRNNPALPGAPTITAFTPAMAGTGTAVIITGTNFSSVTSVTFGGAAAVSYNILSSTSISAVVGAGATGSVSITTQNGTATLAGFTFIPPPVITAAGPTSFYIGGSVALTTGLGTGYTYQWLRNGVNITGATSASYTASQSGAYTVMVTINGSSQTSAAVNVSAAFTLPASNFKIAATSATCKGSANGSITVTAVQNLNYTATVTVNGIPATYPFTTTLTIPNLAAGTYNICFTIAGQADYQQCFNAVVAEPKDLALYSAVIKNTDQAVLSLSGADTYHIALNGVEQTTNNNQVTLTLKNGVNHITLRSDAPCQGVVEQDVVIAGRQVPFPNPFDNAIYVTLGDKVVKTASVRLYDAFNKLVFNQTFTNQSGVVKLNVSQLTLGVYFLRVVADDESMTFKMMKQ